MVTSKKDVSLTSEFYRWMTENLDLNKYIQIDSVIIPSDEESRKRYSEMRQMENLQLRGEITNFLNLNLLANKPQRTEMFPPIPPNSPKICSRLIREIKFLQKEEYRIRIEYYDWAVKQINSLLDFLSEEKNLPDSIIIKISTQELFRDFKKSPPNADRCKCLYEKKIIDLCNEMQKDVDSINPSETLLYILGRCIPRFNNNLHFIELNSQQDRFDHWLFNPVNPISYKITRFLEEFREWPRSMFTNEVFHLFEDLKRLYPQQDPVLGSIFVLMYFRSIFDAAVAIDYYYFFPKTESHAMELMNKILVSDITPPKELLPPHRENEPARIVFNRDIRYKKAGQFVTEAFFYNNPLDILYEIHLALKEMNAGISSKRKQADPRQVLPFETIFTIFFGSLLTSDLPNLEGLVSYIIDLAPTSKLAPEFQYAQVTMTAVLTQFQNFKVEKDKTVL